MPRPTATFPLPSAHLLSPARLPLRPSLVPPSHCRWPPPVISPLRTASHAPRHRTAPPTPCAPPFLTCSPTTTTPPLSTPYGALATLALLLLLPAAVFLPLQVPADFRGFAGAIRRLRSPISHADARIRLPDAPSSSSSPCRAPGSTASPPACPFLPRPPTHAATFSGSSPPSYLSPVSPLPSHLFPVPPSFHSAAQHRPTPVDLAGIDAGTEPRRRPVPRRN